MTGGWEQQTSISLWMNYWCLRSSLYNFDNHEYEAQYLDPCTWHTATNACRQSRSVTIPLLAYAGRPGMISPTFSELGHGRRPLALLNSASSFLTTSHYCLSMERVHQRPQSSTSENTIRHLIQALHCCLVSLKTQPKFQWKITAALNMHAARSPVFIAETDPAIVDNEVIKGTVLWSCCYYFMPTQ